MLVPVSDKADIAQGLDMTYVYGNNQAVFNHVSCDHSQHCWYSGHLGLLKKHDSRLNSLVVRTTAKGTIAWARSYQLNGSDTETLGMLPTRDGGSLLYGNAIVAEHGLSSGPLRPLYEKLDSHGIPQWGGTILLGQIATWSAFSDAIRLADGGYALTGSGIINGSWYGAVLKLDPSGKIAWTAIFNSHKNSTLSYYLIQLKNGHILAVGHNQNLRDLVLFNFSPNGNLTKAPIFHVRGDEVPVGFVPLASGPAIIAHQKMPSGELAALVIQLDDTGRFKNAIRYRYVDGFDPFDVIALPHHGICVYGMSAAPDKKVSLAFTVGADKKPTSALTQKGEGVFISGALFSPSRLVFVGGRPLGVDAHAAGIVTKWSPAIKNEKDILKKISRQSVTVKVYKNQGAKEWSDEKGVAQRLDLSELQTRLVSGAGKSDKAGTP